MILMVDEKKSLKLDKSPMQKYIDDFDFANADASFNEYWKIAISQPYEPWNELFLAELYHREKFKNVVFSFEGEQGLGKSICLLKVCGKISDVYRSKFDLENIHFFNDSFEQALRRGKKRTVYGLDEQTRDYGVMSTYIQDQLANFEDIYRKPQISIGYASPRLRVHEHFFIFKVLGDIEVYEDGSPATVQAMLYTKRRMDDLIMPRARLKFSWVEKKLWDDYEAKKDKFIFDVQDNKDYMMTRIDKDALKIIEKHKEKLLVENAKGVKKIVVRSTLDYLVYDVVGMRAYTMEGYRMLREAVKQKLIDELS